MPLVQLLLVMRPPTAILRIKHFNECHDLNTREWQPWGVKIGTGADPCNGMQTILRLEPNRSLVLEPIPQYSVVPRRSSLLTVNFWNRNRGKPRNEKRAPRFYRGTPRDLAPRNPVLSYTEHVIQIWPPSIEHKYIRLSHNATLVIGMVTHVNMIFSIFYGL